MLSNLIQILDLLFYNVLRFDFWIKILYCTFLNVLFTSIVMQVQHSVIKSYLYLIESLFSYF
jgi:hypothetical protein